MRKLWAACKFIGLVISALIGGAYIFYLFAAVAVNILFGCAYLVFTGEAFNSGLFSGIANCSVVAIEVGALLIAFAAVLERVKPQSGRVLNVFAEHLIVLFVASLFFSIAFAVVARVINSGTSGVVHDEHHYHVPEPNRVHETPRETPRRILAR